MERPALIPSLDSLVPLALDAGRCVLSHYRPETRVETKSDGSPVTDADREAEAIILDGLRNLAPDIAVVAEEEVCAGRVPSSAERFFLVDPLDGTREFVSRNGEFTVNIALVEDGVPTLGLVYAPALGRLFAGGQGGAWQAEVRNGELEARRAMRVRAAPTGLTVVGSRSHGSPATAAFLERFEVEAFAARGSSLKFCLLAAGEADLYPRFGRTMEWDTAAGDAILRAAGGLTATLDGSPLRYDKRDQTHDADFANPNFLAVGDLRLLARACMDSEVSST
nr:3'(2'),5'-bisphosphate nucleotidase CysQ [Aureimonas sp. ME7]